MDGTANRFVELVFTGHYLADVLDDLAEVCSGDLVADEDLAAISAPIDVLGVNYYTTNVFRAGELAGPTPHIAAPDAVEVLRRPAAHRDGLGGRPGRAAQPAHPGCTPTTRVRPACCW